MADGIDLDVAKHDLKVMLNEVLRRPQDWDVSDVARIGIELGEAFSRERAEVERLRADNEAKDARIRAVEELVDDWRNPTPFSSNYNNTFEGGLHRASDLIRAALAVPTDSAQGTDGD